MIVGTVRGTKEAIIRLRVFGFGNGIIHEVQGVIDTGFTDQLTLPSDLIEALELPFVRYIDTMQSDGVPIRVKTHKGEIEWDGERVSISVQESETEPLVGMGLIWGYTLSVRGETNGAVTLTVIESGDAS